MQINIFREAMDKICGFSDSGCLFDIGCGKGCHFELVQPRLRYYAFTLVKQESDVDDLIQVVNARVSIRRELDPNPSKALFSYLKTTLYHEFLLLVKQRKKELNAIRELSFEENSDPEAFSTVNEEIIQKALSCLSEEQREVITLKYFEELSFEEIATLLGESTGAVKMRCYRALPPLKGHIESLAKEYGLSGLFSDFLSE